MKKLSRNIDRRCFDVEIVVYDEKGEHMTFFDDHVSILTVMDVLLTMVEKHDLNASVSVSLS